MLEKPTTASSSKIESTKPDDGSSDLRQVTYIAESGGGEVTVLEKQNAAGKALAKQHKSMEGV